MRCVCGHSILGHRTNLAVGTCDFCGCSVYEPDDGQQHGTCFIPNISNGGYDGKYFLGGDDDDGEDL